MIPRGVRFRVELLDGDGARGYVCENYGARFRLPELGPIGSNGLANARDFERRWPRSRIAKAASSSSRSSAASCGARRSTTRRSTSSPGTATTRRTSYDLARFNTINTVSFDHPDPSIFTVLTSPSDTPGTANVDFVIFPPRWMVAEDTFRPPWFHRNVMSEYMGLDPRRLRRQGRGLRAGRRQPAQLHVRPRPRRRDVREGVAAADARSRTRSTDTLAFMFESRYVIHPTRVALDAPQRQRDYQDCWQGLAKHFTGRR